jgi:spore germination protein GerM
VNPYTRMVGLAVVVVIASGCGVSAQSSARVTDDATVPFSLLDPNAPPLLPADPGTNSELIAACYVKDGKLTSLPVRLDSPVHLSDAVEALLQLPADAPATLRTAIGDPSPVLDVRLEAGVAHVDLAPSLRELSGQEQLLAVAQLVCTLTSRPGVGRVGFTIDGAPVEVPRGDGSLTDEPVSRDDYASLFE